MEKQETIGATLPTRRAVMLIALFITGIGTFAPVYATQPLLPRFREFFRASELLVSLTVSATVLAVALTAPLIGLLSDRMGRKRVIVASLLGLAVSTAMAGTAASLGQLVAWRFVQGCFIPGIMAVAIAYVAEESEARSVGSTMATYVTGTIVGGFGGRLVAGLALARWDWHGAFLVLGGVSLVVALLTWWLLPSSTRFVRRRDLSAADTMGAHMRNPQLLATFAVGFTVLSCLVGAFTYVSFYLADKPFFLGPAALGSIFAVYLVGIVVTPLAGQVIDRIGQLRTLTAATVMCAAGMSLTLVHSVPVIIVGLTLESSGVFISQSAALSHVGQAALEAKSSAGGLYVSFYYFGGFVGSVIPGIFWRQAGWPGCVAIILVFQCLTVVLANRFWRD
jgi:predicted MFS family arabinose efflux permease